jgi:hypothetical protein
MDRRAFLHDSLLGAVLLSSARTSGVTRNSGASVSQTVTVPSPATGQTSSRVTVPDTLDLADRARLAINGLTSAVDSDDHYNMYFLVRWTAKPAYLLHMDIGDFLCCQPKWLESLPLMRVMSGSDQNLDTERKMMQAILDLTDPEDGLFYLPVEDMKTKPWDRRAFYPVATEPITSPLGNARQILAMAAWYQRDHDPVWLDRMYKTARGLGKAAVYKDNYAFYPLGGEGMEFSYLKYSGYKDASEPKGEHEGGIAEGSVLCFQGHQIRALSRWYLMSGDKQALELAGKLSRFVMKPQFWGAQADSKWIVGPERAHYDGHQHGTTLALRGLLEYANAANDQRTKEFVRDGYEYSRARGISRIGCTGGTVWNAQTEGCSIADMVGLAIRLSDYGVGDYWDDADQYIRNQMVEQQPVRPDLLERISEASVEYPDAYKNFPPLPWGPKSYERILKITAPQEPDIRKAIQRGLGLIACFSLPTTLEYPSTNGCCSGNGTQAFYYAWESVVRAQNGDARVNLLLNRASPWLDVDSHLPYEGKVVIRNKTARSIAVRIPGWSNKRDVRGRINEADASPRWVSNYLLFDKVNGGDVVTITFPMVKETAKYMMPFDKEYSCTFKGNTLVDISPRDTNPTGYPIYQRDHYQQDKAPMKEETRYVSNVNIDW